MSYSVDNIIKVTTKFVPGALGFANFGSATLIAPEADLPVGFDVDTYRDYSGVAEMADDGFITTGEPYKVAQKWFSSTPQVTTLRVWGKATVDSYTDSLNTARGDFWWFITLVTTDVLDTAATVEEVAGWCESNRSMFPNTTNEAGAITPGGTSTPKTLTASGYRFSYSTYHADDRYAAIPLMTWFATVNYNVANSTITGEYKTITNVASSVLNSTEQNALKNDEVKCGFITNIDLQGQIVNNRYVNSLTHSASNEFIDDVFNSEAFVNAIKVALFNVTANQPTKLGQTIAGQQAEITAAQAVCEQYIQNGYLGERNYVNPDNGLTEFTRGYEILTRAEDILSITESERTERGCAPLKIRIFRAGAIHIVPVDITIY